MTVGVVQLYNQWGDVLAGDAFNQWDSGTATHFAFLLARSSYTPVRTHTTVADLGTAGTNWINAGDGSPIQVPSRSIENVSGATQFRAGNANFGSSVTVSAKYLVCVAGNSASIGSGDRLIFWQDLRTEGGEATSSSSDFNVQAPANNIWWQINAQVQ
jgi:hypothetical protein